MTREEAESILKNAAWLGSNADRERIEEAVRIAIEALNKQEPMKPRMPLDAYFICPVCAKKISVYDEYCCRCGQSLGRWWEG